MCYCKEGHECKNCRNQRESWCRKPHPYTKASGKDGDKQGRQTRAYSGWLTQRYAN